MSSLPPCYLASPLCPEKLSSGNTRDLPWESQDCSETQSVILPAERTHIVVANFIPTSLTHRLHCREMSLWEPETARKEAGGPKCQVPGAPTNPCHLGKFRYRLGCPKVLPDHMAVPSPPMYGSGEACDWKFRGASLPSTLSTQQQAWGCC